MWSLGRFRAKPIAQEQAPETAPVLGVDYDEYVDPDTFKDRAAKRITPRSFHEPTGVLLTPETFALIRGLGPLGENAQAALDRLANYRYPRDKHGHDMPMPDNDKQHIAAAVQDVAKAIGQCQKALTSGSEEDTLQRAFLSRLKEAARQAGRDKFDFLAQFGRMSPRWQDKFTGEEREALADPQWRAGIVEDIRAYERFRFASQALRREANAIVGGDFLQPTPITTEQRSSGRVTSHDGHAEDKRPGFSGGAGCNRSAGRSNGNGFSL